MVCPNCGQTFEGDRCPNCGHPVASKGARIAAVVLAVLIVLPLAVFGACGLVIGLPGIFSKGQDGAIAGGFIMFALAAIGLAVLIGLTARDMWRG